MPLQRARFGAFELDMQTGELWRGGRAVALQEQPFRVLLLILEHGSELTTREEIRKALWPDDTFVDFDHGINTAIKKIRQALGDSADEPKYIQTVARRGYRCILPVEWPAGRAVPPDKSEPTSKSEPANEPPSADEPRQAHAGLPQHPDEQKSLTLSWQIGKLLSGLRKPWVIVTTATLLLLAVLLTGSLPRIGRLFNDRGVELQQRGQLEDAIRNYRRAIALDSGYAAAHYNLADAYEEIPNYDNAQEEYQRAIDADVSFYPAYNNLSRLYILRRRDYPTALTLLDRAFASGPRDASVLYSLRKNYGWADFELGNLSQAEQQLRIAVGLDAERGSAHCLLAKVLEAQGKVEDAKPEWVSCLAYSAGPDVEPEWRVETQERLGKKAVQ